MTSNLQKLREYLNDVNERQNMLKIDIILEKIDELEQETPDKPLPDFKHDTTYVGYFRDLGEQIEKITTFLNKK